MEALHIVLVLAVCLLQSLSGDCADFSKRFNDIAAYANRHGGYQNPEAKRMLFELKMDMEQACREGILQEVGGYSGIYYVAGTTTKAYLMLLPHSTVKEHHVLPDVDCRLIRTKSQNLYGDLYEPRVTPLLEQRMAPALFPSSQNQRTQQTIPLWWLQFSTQFETIKQDTMQNGGYLTREGNLAIENLKHDMMSVCQSGYMRVVGLGKDIKGMFNEVTIPTKVYALTLVPYYEEKTLPDIDCSVTSRFLEDAETGRRRSLEERVSPISSNYDNPRPFGSLPRSTSLTQDALRRHGFLMRDDQNSYRSSGG